MPDPIPVNLAKIEQKQSQVDTKELMARQAASKARLVEDMERGFNPDAVQREQKRHNKFRNLEMRKKPEADEPNKVQEVGKKTEEDLADQYGKRNPELIPDRLRHLRSSLRGAAGPEEILKHAEAAFEDATLVDEALEYLEKDADPSLRANIRLARELLNETKGREVIAGRNVDSAAKSFHKKGIGKNPSELRELYRDITGNPRGHNALFSQLAAMYPFNQLKMVVAFLLKGLGFDLKSKGPSIQSAELLRLMSETRNLQSILWVYLFFKSRLKMIKNQYGRYGLTYQERLTFEHMAKAFVATVEERYPSVLKLLKVADKLGLKQDEEKVIILSQFRDAVRGLSPRLYRSMRHRQDLLLVIMETLEELETEPEDEEADT